MLIFAIVAFSIVLFVLYTGLGLIDLADRLSRRYRGRPPRWSDFWED